jgi:hypothetical protein
VLKDGLVVEDTLLVLVNPSLKNQAENPRRRMAKRALSWKRAAAIGWRD